MCIINEQINVKNGTVIIFSFYWDKTYSGWVFLVRKFAKLLQEHGWRVIILTNKNEIDPSSFSSFDVRVFSISNLIRLRKSSYYFILPNLYLRSLKWSPILRLLGYNVIGRICTNELSNRFFFKQVFLLFINKVLFLNFSQKRPKFAKNIFLPNWVPKAVIRYNSFVDIDTIKMVFVGEISDRKNILSFIENFSSRSNTLSREYILDLYGPVSSEQNLNKVLLALENDTKIQINYKGSIANDDVYRVLSYYHILVLPSKLEGMPNILLEAMSQNLFIFASDIPGVRENFTNEDSFLMFDPEFSNFGNVIDKLDVVNFKNIVNSKFILDHRSDDKIYDIIKSNILN